MCNTYQVNPEVPVCILNTFSHCRNSIDNYSSLDSIVFIVYPQGFYFNIATIKKCFPSQ